MIKEQQVEEVFRRLGGFPAPPVLRIIPSPKEFHYRGKAEYHVRTTLTGIVTALGFIDVAQDSVMNIDRCEIVEEGVNQACLSWREALFADERKVTQDRQTIWATPGGDEGTEVPANERLTFVTRVVGNRRLIVPYRGFFQINTSLVPILVEQVAALADLRGGETVVDAYCGVGLFSLFLASRAGSVLGMEISGEAVHCARENVKEAGLMNALFFQGDTGQLLHNKFVRKGRRADVIILDPPRSGCGRAVLEALGAMKVGKVIYISCNPTTQARDMRYLVDRGYELACLQPLDMFPQTGHCEVIGLLQAK